MSVPLVAFSYRDIYIDYPFEEVTYRWNLRTKSAYIKFYGASERRDCVEHANRLFTDAILYGSEISAVAYAAGFLKKRR